MSIMNVNNIIISYNQALYRKQYYSSSPIVDDMLLKIKFNVFMFI